MKSLFFCVHFIPNMVLAGLIHIITDDNIFLHSKVESHSIVYIHYVFFTHLFMDGYLGWFPILHLWIISKWAQLSFQCADVKPFGSIHTSGNAASHGSSIFNFYRNHHTLFQVGSTNLHTLPAMRVPFFFPSKPVLVLLCCFGWATVLPLRCVSFLHICIFIHFKTRNLQTFSPILSVVSSRY